MNYLFISIMILIASRTLMAYRERLGALVTSGDAMAHLAFVKEYYRTGGRPINLTKKYILEGPDYPKGFHKLLYHLRIPVAWLERFGGYLPIIFDLLQLGLIFIIIRIFGGGNYQWLLAFPLLRLLWGHVGRASHLSERAYGVIFGNIYLVGLVASYITNDYLWLVLSFAGFFVASVSSKFTWQAMTFFSLLLSIFTADTYFVAFFIIFVLLSFVFSHGYSYEVIKGSIRHSSFYRSHLAEINPATPSYYQQLLPFGRDLKRYIVILLRNPLIRTVTDFPLTVVIAYLFIDNKDYIGEFNQLWAIWLLSGLGLVFLIGTNSLRFLGEPERYLEFALVPAFVLLSFISPFEYVAVTSVAVLVLFLVIIFEMLMYIRSDPTAVAARQNDMIELREFCNRYNGVTILTAPFRLSFFLGYENEFNRYVTLFSNIGIGEKMDEYKWLCPERYPFPRKNLKEVIDRYGVNIVVMDKNATNSLAAEGEKPYYDLSSLVKVFDNSSYAVFEIA